MVSRYFATAAAEKYNPEGQMNAVTFHGPRTMKVSQKPKPRLETPGVSMSRPLHYHALPLHYHAFAQLPYTARLDEA